MSPGGNHGTARQRTPIPRLSRFPTLIVTPSNPIHTIQHRSYIISTAHIVKSSYLIILTSILINNAFSIGML